MNDVQAPEPLQLVPSGAARIEGPPLRLLLELDEAAAQALKRQAPALLRPARRPVTRRLRQVYWDTAQHRIGRAGLALGIQTAGQRRQQILREIHRPPAAGRLVIERVGPLDGDALDVTRLAFLPGVEPAAVAEIASEMLVPLFGIDLTRTVWRVAEHETLLAAALEIAEIEAAGGRETLIQLDLALLGGPPEGLYRLARRLLGTVPFRLAENDAVQHGYRMATGSSGWSDAADAALAPGMTVRQGFLAIGRAGAAAVRRTMRALQADLASEPIHEARVALRRLRSVLSVFRPVLPPLAAQQFGRALSEFAKLLGEAREWDVWLEVTVEPLRAALGEHDPVLDQLVGGALAERQLAAVAVADAARSRDFLLLSLGLGAWFDAEIWPEPPSEAEAELLDVGLDDFARTLLRKRHRKLVKAGEGWRNAPPERLHALRIEAKKLRYTAEFLRPLFPARAARRYLAALKSIQDILGAANDATVARRLVSHLTPSDGESAARASGLVAGWTAAEATNAHRRLGEAWDEFLETRRFWKD